MNYMSNLSTNVAAANKTTAGSQGTYASTERQPTMLTRGCDFFISKNLKY